MAYNSLHKAPKLPTKILHWFCKHELLEEIEGDLFEHYQVLREDHAKWKSDLSYWFHFLHFLRPFALKKFGQNSNIIIMYRSYFKFAIRSMWRQKAGTAFNLLGLILAFTVCGLIYLHVQQELSYDKFHNRSEDIYRVAWMNDNPQTRTPHPMAQAMVNDFPEVESAVSISPIYGAGLTKQTIKLTLEKDNISFNEPDGFFVDSTFFDVFDFKFLEGNPETALNSSWGVILSKSTAERYFVDKPAIGNRLSFDINTDMLEVVGVVEDAPVNSHFHFNFLISYVSLKSLDFNDPWLSWGDFGHFNYVKRKANATESVVEAIIPNWIGGYLGWPEESLEDLKTGIDRFDLQPITSIHLTSNIRWELEANSSYTYLFIYGVSGLFILLISIINFVNLSTARSAQRLKEVGVKKAIGARKSELLSQFIFETTLTTYLSLGLSLLVIYNLEAQFNNLVQGQISVNEIFTLESILFLIAVTTATALIAAIYPSVYLNAQKPGDILKGLSGKKIGGSKVRNTLLGVQLVAAIVMISGSLIINGQINYLKNKDLGFEQEQIAYIALDNYVNKSEVVKNNMLKISGVESIAAISNVPGGQFNQHPIYLEDAPDNQVDASEVFLDDDAMNVLGLEIIDGRMLDETMAADSAGVSFIINETAVKVLNLKEPVGKNLFWVDNENLVKGQIIGVAKDFHFKSLHVPIRPLIMMSRPQGFNYLVASLDADNYSSIIPQLEEEYSKVFPSNEFDMKFLDTEIESLYEEESRTLLLTSILSVISIFLSIAGLIGIVMIAIKQRVKEIGTRKVLGASMAQILTLINGRFLIITGIATLIGIPTTWLLMSSWLGNFTYQNGISPFSFIITAAGLLVLIFVTISAIAIKTAKGNPSLALRNE